MSFANFQVDGPIEFVFNELQAQLSKRLHEARDDATFHTLVLSIITNLGANFDHTFAHCGYQ